MLRISRPRTRSAADGKAGVNEPPDVAANLRRLRQQRGYSLETLARLSGVSRAMLGQIETGKSAPTVTLLWKVATALGVALSDLIESTKTSNTFVIRRDRLRAVSLSDGKGESVAYTAPGLPARFDVTQLRLSGGHTELFSALGQQALAFLILTSGTIAIRLDERASETLAAGDAILFEAGSQYEVSNDGTEDAIAYLIVSAHWNGRVT